MREELERLRAAFASVQELAIEREKLVRGLRERVDADERTVQECETILNALRFEPRFRVLRREFAGVEARASGVATAEDVILACRRILRHELESEEAVQAHLKDAPSMRELVRSLVHAFNMETATGPDGPINHYAIDQTGYLAANFSQETRRKCFFHHYDVLTDLVSDTALKLLLRDGVTLYETRPAEATYSVVLAMPQRGAFEGELFLHFYADEILLYITSFSIVPGSALGLDHRNAILIGHMQGQSRAPEAFRAAARDNGDITPQAFLFAALEGLARAIGVECIAGPEPTNLVSYKQRFADHFATAYDHFFASIGAVGPKNGFYVWSASAPEKPLSEVKAAHRRRTKAKRRLRAEIATRICLSWPLLMEPTYEFLRFSGRATELAILRSRIEILLRAGGAGDLAGTARLAAAYEAIARLAARVTRGLKWLRPFMSRRAFETRALKRGLLDERWYLETYRDVAAAGMDPVEHYIAFGASEGRDPNPFFSTRDYVAANPGIAQSGMNPLVHYCLYGDVGSDAAVRAARARLGDA